MEKLVCAGPSSARELVSKRAVGNMACKSVEAFPYVVLFVMCAVFSPEGPEAYDWASGCGDRDGGQERDGDDYVKEVL